MNGPVSGPVPVGVEPRVRRRYHLHAPGFVYVVVLLFVAIGAVNSQNNLLFAALGLGIGGLLMSGVLSGSGLMRLRVRRLALGDATVGRPWTVEYELWSTHRWLPIMGIHVVEGTVSGTAVVEPSPATFAHVVRPGARVHLAATATPTRRGTVRLRSVRAWSTFPFGLTKKSVTVEQPGEAVVYPACLPLRADRLREVLAPAMAGSRARALAGTGGDFFALREYVPGDTLRRVAWRATARRGELVVRQESAVVPTRVWVGVAAAPGAEAMELERCAALAASLVVAAEQRDLAFAVALDDPARAGTPRTGRSHRDRCLRELALWTGERRAAGGERALGRGAAVIVVHAGAIVRGAWPADAVHVAASELAAWADADAPGSAEVLRVLGVGGGEDGTNAGRGDVDGAAAEGARR